MARMSREFSLVLLGAGLLTAGYFLMPEDDPLRRAARDAEGKGAGGSRGGRSGHVVIFYSGGRSRSFGSSSPTATSRGGFGRSAFRAGS